MANRNRPIQVKFRVTPEERKIIDKRMEQAGTNNMAAYLRKMAIDGYVVKLELPELRDMVSSLRSTGRIYTEDIHEMKTLLESQWEIGNRVLESLAALS